MKHDEMASELVRAGWKVSPPPRSASAATEAECAARQQRIAARERDEIAKARIAGKAHSYVDEDGCEVTVTPSGHSFYNAGDWY